MTTSDHSVLMDDVYRYQRHIYDASRKFYLLGRDRLIDALDLDGLGDDERAAVRRERKALVLRCERLSAKV